MLRKYFDNVIFLSRFINDFVKKTTGKWKVRYISSINSLAGRACNFPFFNRLTLWFLNNGQSKRF